jgi:hypothetical protein
MYLLLLLQQPTIEEKIKNSPDNAYQLGVLIGSFLPLVVLAGLAYWMYYRAKKSNRKE